MASISFVSSVVEVCASARCEVNINSKKRSIYRIFKYKKRAPMRCSFEGKKGLIITVFHFFLFHSFLYLPFFIDELLFFLFH